MTKYEFNYLCKQIDKLKEALKVVTDQRERKRMFGRLEGLKLLRDNEINKSMGVII